jgi:hypothetical protein
MNIPINDIRGNIPVNGQRVQNYEQMMKKFQKLNAEYNKMANQGYTQKEKDDELSDNIDREKDYQMINLLKQMNSSITEKITNIKSHRDDLEKYESYKTEMEKLAKAIDDINDLYEDTVVKSNNFFSFDIPKLEKKIFDKDSVDNVINAVNDVITDRISKISLLNQNIVEYKKLINECLPKEDVETIQAISNELLCSVCLTNKINVCITPCGHTFCDKCTAHMKSSCYMCKGNVANKVKLYLGTNGTADGDDGIQVQPRPANFEAYAPAGMFNFNEIQFNAVMEGGGNEVPQYGGRVDPPAFIQNYAGNAPNPVRNFPGNAPRNIPVNEPIIRAEPPQPNAVVGEWNVAEIEPAIFGPDFEVPQDVLNIINAVEREFGGAEIDGEMIDMELQNMIPMEMQELELVNNEIPVD